MQTPPLYAYLWGIGTQWYIYDILLLSFQTTYEELKQQTQCSYKLWHRFQFTYKELKRISISRKPPRAVRFQTTYEELKLYLSKTIRSFESRFQTTYEELKQHLGDI